MHYKGRALCQLSVKTKVNLERNFILEKKGSAVNPCIQVIALHHFARGVVYPAIEGTIYSESALQL